MFIKVIVTENSKLNIQLPFIKPKTISVFAQFPLLSLR